MEHSLKAQCTNWKRLQLFAAKAIQFSLLRWINCTCRLSSRVHFLADGSGDDSTCKKEQLLQFLLGLANLHQYLSHHASLVGKPN